MQLILNAGLSYNINWIYRAPICQRVQGTFTYYYPWSLHQYQSLNFLSSMERIPEYSLRVIHLTASSKVNPNL